MGIPEEYLGNVHEFCFPYVDREHEYRYITVTERGRVGDERWAILDNPHCWNRVTQQWEYEPRASEREDDWMDQTRMPLAEALPLAKALAEELRKEAIERVRRMLTVRVEYLGRQIRETVNAGDSEKFGRLQEEVKVAMQHLDEWNEEHPA